MPENNIKQPLVVYDSLDQQNRFREGYMSGGFTFISQNTKLPMFQIRRAAALGGVSSIKLVDLNDNDLLELLPAIDASDLDVFNFQTFDQIVHYGAIDLLTPIAEGKYYLKITSASKEWYTEEIKFIDFDADALDGCVASKLVYTRECDLAKTIFKTEALGGKKYINTVFFESEINIPEWPYSDDGEENSEGVFEADFRKSEKSYSLEEVVPEFFVDAMVLLPMFLEKGSVALYTKHKSMLEIHDIKVEPEWLDTNGVANRLNILIHTDLVHDTNCCEVEELPFSGCVRGGYRVAALILESGSDYTNFEYTNVLSGLTSFVHGDLVLTEDGAGKISIRRFLNGAWDNTFLLSQGDEATDLNELNGNNLNPDIYYFYGGVVGFIAYPTMVYDSINSSVSGECWRACIVEVWVILQDTTHVKMTEDTGNVYNTSFIAFTQPATAAQVYCKFIGLSCELGQTDPEDLEAQGRILDDSGSPILDDSGSPIFGQ